MSPKLRRREIKSLRHTFAATYQLAGELTMMRDTLTAGQVIRLETLLLDILSRPDAWPADVIYRVREDAKRP